MDDDDIIEGDIYSASRFVTTPAHLISPQLPLHFFCLQNDVVNYFMMIFVERSDNTRSLYAVLCAYIEASIILIFFLRMCRWSEVGWCPKTKSNPTQRLAAMTVWSVAQTELLERGKDNYCTPTTLFFSHRRQSSSLGGKL
jgi:hypothetical protein